MKKYISRLGLFLVAIIPIFSVIACGKVNSYDNSTIPNIVKINHKLDEEGFPIHLDTEIVKGEGDLSLGRVIKHLKKYLPDLSKDGSNIKFVQLGLVKFGADNIWECNYFQEDISNEKYNKTWNDGFKVPNKIWEKKSPKLDDFNDNYEYIYSLGWKRFLKKEFQQWTTKQILNSPDSYKKIGFDLFINAYPLLDKPTEMKIVIFVADTIYHKVQILDLGNIPNINPKNIINIEHQSIKEEKQINKNILQFKEIIKKIVDFKNNFKFFDLIPKKLRNEDIIKEISNVLNNKANEKFIIDNMETIYKKMINSPYININNLPTINKEETQLSNTFAEKLLFYILPILSKPRKDENYIPINHLFYMVMSIYDYIIDNNPKYSKVKS